MSGNLIRNPSFETPGTGGQQFAFWQTSGNVTREPALLSFEGQHVAQLMDSPVIVVHPAILSQQAQVPSSYTHLHLQFAYRQTNNPPSPFQVQIQWLGSANAGLPILRTETLISLQAGSTANPTEWVTYYAATEAKPNGTVWARLRFILSPVEGRAVFVDWVVLTGEAP